MVVYKSVLWRGTNDIEIIERPVPKPGPGEVLIRVRAAGICGTDLHILSGHHPEARPPLVPGHEFAGEIAAVGRGVDLLKTGLRVGADSYRGCGKCRYCISGERQLCENGTCELGVNIDGGWAEYVVVPEENIYKLPENVGFHQAGAGCILNCPPAAVEQVKVHSGDTVLIIGDGPSSLTMLQFARLKGAANITVAGHRELRLSIAEKLGADTVINTHVTALEGTGVEADVVIDAVGSSETFRTALLTAKKRARVHLFGLPEGSLGDLPMDMLLWKELTITGSTGDPRLWPVAMTYLSKGLLNVDPVISHRFPIDQAPQAIDFIKNNPQKVVKAIFEMP